MCCKDRPLVSVAMGVRYRRDDMYLLERAVNSILAQSYDNIEFLICEFDSRPEVRERLAQIVRSDARVRLVDGEGADTLSEKLNRCITAANGPYIARMDDDDFSEPERIEKQVAFLERNTDAAFVGCAVELEQDGASAGMRKLPEVPEEKDFLFVQPYIHPSLLFRREALDAAAGYSEDPGRVGCEDYDLLLRLYGLGYRGRNMPETLLRYTLPATGSKGRPMWMRVNEVKTRYLRIKDLGFLPRYFPYVVKPVIVGLIPAPLLESLKRGRQGRA